MLLYIKTYRFLLPIIILKFIVAYKANPLKSVIGSKFLISALNNNYFAFLALIFPQKNTELL